MPHTNKASAPVSIDIPELEGRYVDLDGYTVSFETYKADVDPAEFFRGYRTTVASVRIGAWC